MNRILLPLLLLMGCAHTQADEMTVEEHQAEARAHGAKAKEEEGKFKDGMFVRGPARTPFGEPGEDWVFYNPTEHHLDVADSELRKVASHLAAAQSLEGFEDAACREIPKAERSACPLLASWVTQVQETRTGLRLVLKGTVDGADVNRRLNCHLAYARARGFDRPSCPLFMKGLTIVLEEPGVLAFKAADAAVAQQLHAEGRRIFTGDIVPAVSNR